MARVFVVSCTRSPSRYLKKKGVVQWKDDVGRYAGATIRQRQPTSADALPDPSWAGRVVAVVEVSATSVRDPLVGWVEGLAASARGAVFDARDKAFSFLGDEDAATCAKNLLGAGEIASLAAMIRACSPEPYDHESRRWATITALRKVVLPALKRVGKPATRKTPSLDAAQACELALALYRAYPEDGALEDHVLATATTPEQKDRAARISERRDQHADDMAPVPKSMTAARALFEAVAAGDTRAERRLTRFLRHYGDAMRELAIASVEAGYDPPPEVVACVIPSLSIEYMSNHDRERLAKPRPGALAQQLAAAVAAYRDLAGQRASDYSARRYTEYERYRDDPLVRKPRLRSDDVAMFRGLNDALWGPDRDRPELPERVIALLCDRRFDDARAAYIEALGEANADAALRDAIEHFAPDLD